MSYGMPAFKVQGKTMLPGFAAFKNHLSYLPHSGSVLSEFPDDIASYVTTKGSLHFWSTLRSQSARDEADCHADQSALIVVVSADRTDSMRCS